MTKWELAEMMGAELIFDRNRSATFNTTLKFAGQSRRWTTNGPTPNYEYAAERVFSMIREAVKHAHNTWSHA